MHAENITSLFVGWRLESGLRYQQILQIADFESVRGGDFKWRFVRNVHEKEVYFPDAVFPFAEARQQAILSLKSPDENCANSAGHCVALCT